MAFTDLHITGFRNLLSVQLKPIPTGFNVIYGVNGSGKTSLLEAIYYLSLARSFRCPLASRIINHSSHKLAIFAQFAADTGQIVPIGLERQANSQLKLRLQGQDVSSIIDIAHLVPVQLIDSHCHHLLEGAPTQRRKYLDWGIFYLNNGFLRSWRQFVRAIKQRNAALRRRSLGPELTAWAPELCESALQIDQFRRQYVELLVPYIKKWASELLPLDGLKIKYESGLGPSPDYQKNLNENLSKDMALGHTQFGPHKADLKITINDIPAKDILSRGQQKLFVCAMILSRGALLQSRVNKRPIYLVDDLPSELDANNRSSLIALLSRQDTQIFITAAENRSWDEVLTMGPMKMFHVEHGRVSEDSKIQCGGVA